jgi:hypothetical protein
MNKKGQTVGVILTIFIIVIVGLVFVKEIATQQGVATTKSTITNESVSIISAKFIQNASINSAVTLYLTDQYSDATDWRRTGCPITLTLLNGTGSVLTNGTDYVFDSSGSFTLKNTVIVNGSQSANGNTTYATYVACREGYNADQGSRSVAGMWTLFAALALVAAVLIGIKQWLNNR